MIPPIAVNLVYLKANFNPIWRQTTDVTEIIVEEDSVLSYENFDFQDIKLRSSINVSDFDFGDLDMWTSDAQGSQHVFYKPRPY